MRVLLFLLFCIFPITSFASEFSFNHTKTVDLVFLSSGLSLHDEYRNCDTNRQTEYFPGLKTFNGNMSNFVHIPGMTVFTSDDVQMPGVIGTLETATGVTKIEISTANCAAVKVSRKKR